MSRRSWTILLSLLSDPTIRQKTIVFGALNIETTVVISLLHFCVTTKPRY